MHQISIHYQQAAVPFTILKWLSWNSREIFFKNASTKVAWLQASLNDCIRSTFCEFNFIAYCRYCQSQIKLLLLFEHTASLFKLHQLYNKQSYNRLSYIIPQIVSTLNWNSALQLSWQRDILLDSSFTHIFIHRIR